jgi:serine protease AprX
MRPTAVRPATRFRMVATLVALFAGSVVAQGPAPHRARLSSDLLSHEARHTQRPTRVIIHGSPPMVQAIASRHHLSVLRLLGEAGVLAVNSAELTDLASDFAVDHVSPDLPVHPAMSVSNISTAAATVRAGSPGILGVGAIPGVTGHGIGVALLDSGITPHAALPNVVASVSLVTGDTNVTDEFGHGTHVAGIVGGSAAAAAGVTPLYTGGIAPGAALVSVKVLGPNGSGLTSDVIAGMEWAISNQASFNIRVINLSLGHPVTEPAETDPLCEEVAKATSLGIVVVASAGNSGKTPDGHEVLGGITSPGNSPFAITVGALNTWQTIDRADDSVTTYSSRGPTQYDLGVKPDVVAPGNKIVSLQAADSNLATTYPALYVAGVNNNAYMRLSGTSMAAPMVSGAVALLLDGAPNLSLSQIKLALQAGATFLPNDGLMAGGAGSVDFWSTRQTTANGLGWLVGQVTGLLTRPSGAAYWDAGSMTNRLYQGAGIRLLSALEAPLVWLNTSLLNWGDLNLLGLSNPLASIPAKNLLYGQVANWTGSNQIFWGDQINDPQGQQIFWGDANQTDDYQIIWGDSVLTSTDPS